MSDHADGVGSLAEEATKLVSALAGLAREHGADLGDGLSDVSDRLAAAAHDVDEHLATGGADCTYCPVCRAIHVLRETSPDVIHHLTAAASSLVQAAAGLLATAVPEQQADASAGVEHIDLDGDVSAEDLEEGDR